MKIERLIIKFDNGKIVLADPRVDRNGYTWYVMPGNGGQGLSVGDIRDELTALVDVIFDYLDGYNRYAQKQKGDGE